MKYRQGWTMVELLIVLAIFSLLAGLASQALVPLLENHRARSNLNQLYHLLEFSRYQAVIQRQMVTVCPSLDGTACTTDWSAPVLAFTDSNSNERIDAGDQLLRELTLSLDRQQIIMRASAQRQFLQFKPSGVSNGIAGSLVICDKSHSYYPTRLVVSLTGRISLKDIGFKSSC
jgi:type IV fimbrial biogenesis protein FimT